MGSNKDLARLRDRIDEVYRNFISTSEDGILSLNVILQEVKIKLRTEIRSTESALIDVALLRFIHGVGRRREYRSSGTQEPDFFYGYKRIPQSVSISGGKKKRTAKLTIVEAESYLEEHSPKAFEDRRHEFRRMVEDCKLFRKSDTDTLEVLMERRAAAEAENR